jgi:Flp pilus assembly protein TadD
LIGAANDSEPWVRIPAVRTLGVLADDPRAASAVAAHLNDTSRVVRVRAAEALMNQGIKSLEGPGQRVLAAAQDEWAESLRTFGDIASDHTTLGWLFAQRGDADRAEKELQIGASLDPADARPHVYLGVLSARAGRYDQALQQFKTAKTLNSLYRNLDRLIEEVEKRSIKRD